MNRFVVVGRGGAGAAALVLLLSACGKPAGGGGGGGQGKAQGVAAVQVVAVEARRQALAETLPLVGNVSANEMVEIKAETDGIVEEINFNEGQRVEKGTLLLKLDETKFAASLAQAEANHKLAIANYERAQQLHRDKLISQQDYDQTASSFAASEAALNLMRRQLRDARIHAPFAGITADRQISPGQVITRNTVVTRLVDLDVVKVEVRVPEKYLGQVQIGQRLQFKVAAFPNDTFEGGVYFVSPQVDEGTRTALVKARISNGDGRLRAGMYANLYLTLRLRDDALVIPEPALVSNGDAFMVFAVDEKTNAVVRPVTVGIRLAGKAEVLTGLKVGERVVVEGVQKIRPGGALRLSPSEAAIPYSN